MNSLPPEARKLIFGFLRPPDPALLMVRAVCRAWRDAVPWGDLMMGVSRETAEWLIGGKEVEWTLIMDSDAFRAEGYGFMSISTPGIYLSSEGKGACVKVGCVEYNVFAGRRSILMEFIDNANKDSSFHFFATDGLLVNACAWMNHVFVLNVEGKIYKVDVPESKEQTFQLFDNIEKHVWKQRTLAVPMTGQVEVSFRNLNKFMTSDGSSFWFLSENSELLHMPSGGCEFARVATDVRDFAIVDDSVLYAQGETLKLLNVNASKFTTKVWQQMRGYHFGNVGYFPEFKCILLNVFDDSSYRRTIIRKGAPFLLPSGKPEACVSDEEISVLETRLSIAERKLAKEEAALL